MKAVIPLVETHEDRDDIYMGKKGTKRKTRWRVLPIGGE